MTDREKSSADHHLGIYLSEWTDRELQLTRLHEEIISKREALLNCSVAYHQSQEQRNRHGTQTAEQAYLRNHKLLQDIKAAKDRLYDALNSSPTPRFMTLQKNYWAMVRSQLPMWEQDLGIQRTKVRAGRPKSKSPDRKAQGTRPKSRASKKQRKQQQQHK